MINFLKKDVIMINKEQISILDCTLRDGGFLL